MPGGDQAFAEIWPELLETRFQGITWNAKARIIPNHSNPNHSIKRLLVNAGGRGRRHIVNQLALCEFSQIILQ